MSRLLRALRADRRLALVVAPLFGVIALWVASGSGEAATTNRAAPASTTTTTHPQRPNPYALVNPPASADQVGSVPPAEQAWRDKGAAVRGATVSRAGSPLTGAGSSRSSGAGPAVVAGATTIAGGTTAPLGATTTTAPAGATTTSTVAGTTTTTTPGGGFPSPELSESSSPILLLLVGGVVVGAVVAWRVVSLRRSSGRRGGGGQRS